MKTLNEENRIQPMIMRYSTSMNSGVEQFTIARHAIGYVVRGDKYIYDGDKSLHAGRGDIFFLSKGTHYVEDISEKHSHFEQIIFYISPEELKNIITTFSVSYNLDITNNHTCAKCRRGNAITMHAPLHLKNFFTNSLSCIYDDNFSHEVAAESIKLTELIYLIASHEDDCLKSKVIGCIDIERNSFEQVIYNNTFNDIPIEELATMCNRSLTSFKKEFKRIFENSPHQWFLQQRLSYSRLLLISTRKSVAQIGAECAFPNTSHFIKLYKRTYKCTPSIYRQRHQSQLDHSLESAEPLSQSEIEEFHQPMLAY